MVFNKVIVIYLFTIHYQVKNDVSFSLCKYIKKHRNRFRKKIKQGENLPVIVNQNQIKK